ncbi:MAG: ribonuclease H-like domain-containing protein [Spirochaetia bacterium]|nr:ribonuclease H-like domain-containing protein [Spirochaetia bacterium]
MAKLSGRLNQLRELREAGATGSADERGKVGRNDAPLPWTGWRAIAPYVWKRSLVLPCPLETQHVEGLLLTNSSLLPKLVFYDFETTGLSGGAGTIIFLAGFGRIEGEKLHIEQILLVDYPGEPAFIRALLPYLSSDKLFVSYNGKGFDRHMLLNRLRIHGYHNTDMPRQLDLLYPTRKIWGKSLKKCNLGRIEELVLNINREDDIEGALIPECYQEFLRTQEAGCMRRVVAHHVQDIASLAQLLFHIERTAMNPESLPDGQARLGLGLLMLQINETRAISIFEAELSAGNEAAGRILVSFYKSRRHLTELREVLAKMRALRAGYFQLIETAKILEHIDKQPKAALSLIQPLLQQRALLSKVNYNELQHRLRRLERKISAM